MPNIFSVDLLVIQPIVALVCGFLILMVPRLLNYLVAANLILIGVAGLWPHLLAPTPQ